MDATMMIRAQLQAQSSRGGFLAGAFRPEQEGQLRAALGGDLQAAQAAEADLFRPGQYRTAPAAMQGLFAGPQGFFSVACPHHQQVIQQ